MLGDKQKRAITVNFDKIRWVRGHTFCDGYEAEHGPDVANLIDRALQTPELSEAQVEQMLSDYSATALRAEDRDGYRPSCTFHLTDGPIGRLGVHWY